MSGEPVIERTTEGEEETIALGAQIARWLAPGEVVALHGALGAGKTRLVRGLAEGLGHDARLVSSPTFVLMNEYDSPGARAPLVHVDAYRIGEEDFLSLGWEHAVSGGAIAVVEWAERVEGALPPDRVEVVLEHVGPTTRRVVITLPAKVAARRVKKCPVCAGLVTPEAASFPFCSERCRLVDLGRWADERYRISRKAEERDLEEG